MDCKLGFELTERAEADLDEILSYMSISLANPQAAAEFLDKLEKLIEDLRLFPEMGTLLANELLPRTKVRKFPAGNYLLYYLPDYERGVLFVLRIVYGKRSLPEIVRALSV